jgi:hypothetical protein
MGLNTEKVAVVAIAPPNKANWSDDKRFKYCSIEIGARWLAF